MRFTLRTKLALISLLLLFIPLAGFRLGELIKQDLLTSQEQTLLFSARVVATALSSQAGLYNRELLDTQTPGKDLYLHKLEKPIRLNGKVDDWQKVLSEANRFGENHLLFKAMAYDPSSLHFHHITGQRGNYIYALFIVTDNRIIYRAPNSLRLDLSDHLSIGFEDTEGTLHRYLVTARKVGWVNGFLIPAENQADSKDVVPEPRIQGMWLETEKGYNLEIRIPQSMVGQKLAFAITDIDTPVHREKTYVIGTGDGKRDEEFGWLVSSSEALDTILQSFSRPHSRIMIVDRNKRVRASHGELSMAEVAETDQPQQSLLAATSNIVHQLFAPLYDLFITSFTQEIGKTPANLTTLDLAGLDQALEGTSTVSRYSPPQEDGEIIAAILPLQQEDRVIGAIVVEQTTNSILALQNRVIEESLTLTILIFSFGGFGLLLFASRLSARIRSLGREASQALSNSGQTKFQFNAQSSSDELGELSRSLGAMLEQLKVQADFREKMADNLEHEMRTPLAGISASLRNLAGELEAPPKHVATYLEWALADVGRLESILTAIRDATSLREMGLQDQKEEFDLGNAISMWLAHSWQPAFPEVCFEYLRPESTILFYGDPARIHQMLDKLIENAVSFHKEQTPVTLSLQLKQNTITIKVSNQGATIPPEIQSQIFNSMVSRRQTKDKKPHLGLGLFIVRTIAEQYQGTISVNSVEGENRTTFIVCFNC